MIKRFFGWLFLTKAYMATLSDDEVARRAGMKPRFPSTRAFSYSIENSQRTTEQILERMRARRAAREAQNGSAPFKLLAGLCLLFLGLLAFAISMTVLFKISIGTAFGVMLVNAFGYFFVGAATQVLKS